MGPEAAPARHSAKPSGPGLSNVGPYLSAARATARSRAVDTTAWGPLHGYAEGSPGSPSPPAAASPAAAAAAAVIPSGSSPSEGRIRGSVGLGLSQRRPAQRPGSRPP